jgi:hypothetical protein
MKYIYLLVTGIFFSFNTIANDPSSALLLQSGTIYPQNNIDEFIGSDISVTDVVNGYYYRLIQFENFPDDIQKEKIRHAGIILNMYLPYRTYSCAIPVNFDRNLLKDLHAVSVMKWENNFVIHKDLTGGGFPSHCINEKGTVDLIVHYQQNISEADAVTLFENKGYHIVNALPLIHAVTLRIPDNRLGPVASLPFVYFIEAIAPPSIKDDTEGRTLHRSNMINADNVTGLHYDGTGVTVGIADDGEIGPHIDFTGRMVNHASGFGSSHGDMTSGICAGAGNLDPKIRGMASGATLHVFDISGYNHITDIVNHYTNFSMVITSTSYSQGCNEYTTASEFGDQVIHDNPQFELVFSAGNDGTGDCGYGAGNGWGNITGGYKVGKNVVACGNLSNTDVLQGSSSRGPAPDGRIKPDICSNGYNQLSTDENNTYQVGGGTSAASPGVAGVFAQLYEVYKTLTGAANPPSALIKACVLNTGEDLGNPGPDYEFGWGRINAWRAYKTLRDQRYISDSISQGQTNTYPLNVPSGVRQLRVMMYYHDEPGTPLAAKSLVNDLNLVVKDPSTNIITPWVLNPAPVASTLDDPAIRGIDSLNNVEQITIDNPVPGSYSMEVEGLQLPLSQQNYYLVFEFVSDSITVTYPNGGEGFVPTDNEFIRWDAVGDTGFFQISYSLDNGSSWTIAQNALTGASRLYSWNTPNVISDRALIRISRNGMTDQSDSLFTIISVPSNLHVTFVCPDSIGLAWNAVSGATGYTVSMLGARYMNDVGTTTTTNFTVTGTQATNGYWFSVAALAQNGGKGLRANAIYSPPGTTNCILSMDGGVTQIVNPSAELLLSCQSLANIPVIVDLKNEGANPISNFDVSYSVNGAGTVTETYTGTLSPNASAQFTFQQAISFPGNGIFDVRIWISVPGDLYLFNDTLNVLITVIPGITGTIPQTEDFESIALCPTANDCELTNCALGNGWQNAANGLYDDIDWRVNQGSTPSTSTGPDMDHTTGLSTGNYIYLEASACASKNAMLLSPCYDLSGMTDAQLTFWYHMYGASMGELHTDIIANGQLHADVLPVKSGNLGNFWRKDSVQLTQFIGQNIIVRFRGNTSINITGDMALDDINVEDLSIGIDKVNSTSFKIYPNPGSGVFRYTLANKSTSINLLSVRDVLGKIIYEKELGQTTTGTIDLTSCAKGIYFVEIGAQVVKVVLQ